MSPTVAQQIEDAHKMTLQRFGVSVPDELLARFDNLVRQKGYVGRSEAIRDAMRMYLSQSAWDSEQGGNMAALNIVYEHRPRLMSDLVRAQHGSRAHVISSLHVHLTESRCFEVMTLRGARHDIEDLANMVSGFSGVEHARLFAFSIPQEDPEHEEH